MHNTQEVKQVVEDEMSCIYANGIIQQKNPLTDRREIFKLADLDWKYVVKPLHYYDDQKRTHISEAKQLLISRDGELTCVAVRGKDFKITSPDDLYDVFLKLREPLELSLYAMGHTRGGKYIYIVALIGKNTLTSNPSQMQKAIIIYTVNDGNGKTKLDPIYLSSEQQQYQVSAISYDKNDSEKQTTTCFELSHHYDFDSLEASVEVKGLLESHFEDFEAKMASMGSIKCEMDDIKEFHNAIYEKRFCIGNEKTILNREKAMADLMKHYEKFNKNRPNELQDTYLTTYLALCNYLDQGKRRKLGREGRITSINFTHDNLTKRTGFSEILKMIGKKNK